jgi:hypothetical protein
VAQCVLHVNAIPKYDGIGDEAQRTEPVLLTLAVAFTDFTTATLANHTCEIMPLFGAIQLREYAPSVPFVLHIIE